MGLQSSLSPPNRKSEESDTGERVCHDRPKGETLQETLRERPAEHTQIDPLQVQHTHTHTHSHRCWH